jgi:hypothetical protein
MIDAQQPPPTTIVVNSTGWLGWDWSAIGAGLQIVGVALTLIVLWVAIRTLRQALDAADSDREARLINDLGLIAAQSPVDRILRDDTNGVSIVVQNRSSRIYERLLLRLVGPDGTVLATENAATLAPLDGEVRRNVRIDPISADPRLDVELSDRISGYRWRKQSDGQLWILEAPRRRRRALGALPVRVR